MPHNIFQRAKAYRKKHPKTSYQRAIKIVARHKSGGAVGKVKKRKPRTIVKARTAIITGTSKRSSKNTSSMAKRKKHHTRRRHRSMGAVKHSGIMQTGELLLGLVGGSLVATAIQRVTTKVDNRLIAIGEIVGGMWLSRKDGAIMQGVGYGVASAGAISLMHDVGFLHGVEEMVSGFLNPGMEDEGQSYSQMIQNRQVSGMANGHFVSGISNHSYVGDASEYVDDSYNPGVLGL